MDENEPQTPDSHANVPEAADGQSVGRPTVTLEPDLTDVRSGPLDSILGRPDATDADAGPDVRWCPKCVAPVRPVGRGVCPRHKIFLKSNTGAAKHPLNVRRRNQLRDQLTSEYAPQTMHLRTAVDALAVVLEKLDNARAGSTEHARLVEAQARLFATLNASKAGASESEDLSDTSDDELIERTEALLESLYARRDGRIQYVPPPTETTGDAGRAVRLASAEVGAESTPALAPEEQCEYCRSTLARCAELKANRRDVWRLNHYADPIELERRNAEATKVMYQQVGKPFGNL